MTSDWEVIFRLCLAVLLGGMVGFERSVKGRSAGFRTHILVCMGAALILLTGLHLSHLYQGLTPVDPARLAAQVVSGIGFLGAGTIIQFRDSVRGLTTAASVWASAGIGLAVGAGFYKGAVAATVLVVLALFISRLERRFESLKKKGA